MGKTFSECLAVNQDVAKLATRQALNELNETCTQALGYTFNEAIVNHCPEEKVQKKPTETERKWVSIMNFVVTLSNTCKNYLTTSSLDHTCMLLPSKQYELVCLKSCNAEHEEQLFGQVK